MSVNVPASEWRATTEGGIPIKVVSRTGGFEQTNSQATEVFIIRASDLMAFAIESFPLPYVFLGTVFYPQPRAMTGFPTMVSSRVSYEGLVEGRPLDPFGNDPDAPDGTYEDYVRVTIEYATTPANDEEADPDNPYTFLEVSSNVGAELLVAPVGDTAVWDSTPQVEVKKSDMPDTTKVMVVDWTVRWPQIPWEFFNDTLIDRMRGYIGKVNRTATWLFNYTPAETILFEGFAMREQYTWSEGYAGKSPVELELKFKEKNFEVTQDSATVGVTFQHFWRAGELATVDEDGNTVAKVTPGWYKLLLDTTPTKKYAFETADLYKIFTG